MSVTVSIIMGSKTDDGHLEPAYQLLDKFKIKWEKKFISAHRQPDQLLEYIRAAEASGTQIFVTAAGLAAALPGVVSAHTPKPVIGIPVPGGPLKGVDALLSIVQMPGGIPVATVGVGSNGPKNAAVLCASILSLQDVELKQRLDAYREELKEG